MDQIASADGTISVLAVDHRSSLRQVFRDNGAEPDDRAISELKDDVCRILAPAVSAILVDPATAERCIIRGIIPRETAIICPIESDRRVVVNGVRYTQLDQAFGPRDARRMGAVAVKLLLDYRADISESVEHHAALVKEAAGLCAADELPLILEPVPYRLEREGPDEYCRRYPELVVHMVEQLAEYDVDVFKIPFPGGAKAEAHCARIDEAVATRPWALLGGFKPADELIRELVIALKARASGFIVGRSVWASAVSMSRSARRNFLRQHAHQELARLQAETAVGGTPWRARRTGAGPSAAT